MARVLQSKILPECGGDKLRAVELGAGSGLPALLLAAKGHSVVCTDLPKLLPLIDASYELNKPLLSGAFKSAVLEWGCAEHLAAVKGEGGGEFDLVIAADLLYLEETFGDLVATLRSLSSAKTKVLISFRVRLPELVAGFLALLQEGGFTWEELPRETLAEIHPNKTERFLVARLAH